MSETFAHHPLIRAMGLSPTQARAALALENVLVSAGAGAGKTRTLTARFLALLVQGWPLRSIVAVTFTRKAAREMRHRVREQIWSYLARPDLSPKERERWRDLAAQLDSARIGTIHSLCQEILRSHPVEARVDPDFRVLDEQEMVFLQEEAMADALLWAAEQGDLAELFEWVEERRVYEALRALLTRGHEAWMLLQQHPDRAEAWVQRWDAWLLERQWARLQGIMAQEAWRAAAQVVREAQPWDASDKLAQQVAIAREALDALDRAEGSDAFRPWIQALQGLDLRGGRKNAWPGGAAQVSHVKGALQTLRGFFKKDPKVPGSGREAWLAMALGDEDRRSAQALVRLRAIALQAFALYQRQKEALHALDFDDLETGAVTLLETHPQVRAWWQQEVQALLVDEFQDTNARQARLLALLDGDRGRRFLVGDAKQSIYRFRGADVAVFTRMEQTFAAHGGQVMTMAETYRGHAALVTSLNGLFQPVLGEAQHPWEARFSPLVPARTRPPSHQEASYVDVILAVGPKDEALPVAARAAVQRLMALWDAHGYRPEDTAILCRQASSFGVYEDALEAVGAPFLTLAGKGFFHRPEVRDLIMLARAVADPLDDVALVAALRSPGIGLSDGALYHLAVARGMMQRQAQQASSAQVVPLWHAVWNPPEDFPSEELPRLERGRALLQRLHTRSGRETVASWLKVYVDETGYLGMLAAAGHQRAVRNVTKFLADVRRARVVQVEDFLSWMRSVRDVEAREGEAPVVAEGAVQIMTVHRAKGLEFPLVVLGDVAASGQSSRPLLMAEGEMIWKLSEKQHGQEPPTMYQVLQALESAREAAEEKRLFYVAATRAQEHVIVNGAMNPRSGRQGWLKWLYQALPELESWLKQESESPQAGRLCAPVSGQGMVRCVRLSPQAAEGAVARASRPAREVPPVDPRLWLPLVSEEDETAEREAKAAEAPVEPDLEQRVWRVLPPAAVRRAWAPAWVVGKLVHRAIELERFPDSPHFDPWLEAASRSLGLSHPALLADARQRVRRLLARLARSPLWQEVQAADQRFHEVPYVYQDPQTGEAVRGTLDLLYRKGELWTLVDFKTDRVPADATLDAWIREQGYDRQLARYVAALQRLRGLTPRAVLCFLDVAGQGVVSVDDDITIREQVVAVEGEEGREQLTPGQLARGPKNDQAEGREGVS